MAHLNFQTDGGFDKPTLAKLRAVIRCRSPHFLNEAEIDDVMSKILTDAAVTAAKAESTQDLATIAFAYARHSNYYSRAREFAEDLRRGMAESAREGYAEKAASSHDPTTQIAVRSVLRGLPPHLARALWLCDAEGYTLAEAATMLGVPLSTLNRQRVTARRMFTTAWAA